MTEVVIDEISLPETADALDANDFVALIDVRNRVEAEVLGSTAVNVTPAGVLPYFRDNPNRRRRHFVARVDGAIVGRANLTWPTAADAAEARLNVDVLSAHRGRGVGAALLERIESEAAALDRHVLQSDQPHRPIPGGRRIASPTGWGDLSAEDPGVRFALKHGYQLEMVVRISQIEPRAVAEQTRDRKRTAQKAAGADYQLVQWVGATPDEWIDDMAVLRSGMSTDEPHAGMEVAPDPWDAERIRAHAERQLATGRTLVSTAVEHVPSNRLVGYTELEVDAVDQPAAVQEDTLVLHTHRGHRLGLLLKSANLLHLLELAPSVTVLTTFNAEDNRPMLEVNEALGFDAVGLEGNWQKRR